MIRLTEPAVKQLKAMVLEEKNSPRIDADVAGGCGVSVRFQLVFDEPRRNDKVIDCQGIEIRMDRFTERYLDTETQVDYTEELGFLVGESFTSSDCAIE
ncbi:iron-sulfur cluster biosynthesis family protein [Bacillus sp. FJAT-27231]|uniref:iron-sulfur cluster biosynthesis family protein n=1 Tax=Bacillus sp. FJAT-27231 TaxID=1679168 RepID=UPI000AA716E9|nr:iron-sulfur cluster biosynthesis family protein [Bacillus sp. FJAT-27231]